MEGSIYLFLISKDLIMDICDVDFIRNVHVLNFKGYGLIMGMDWLAYFGVILDCDKRVV